MNLNVKKIINLEIEIKNSNPKISLKNEKKFSFTKSKKLIRKKSEKDLKEMYLLAGIAQNEEKLFSYNDVLLLTHKNSYSNGIRGDTTITNNNNLSENNFNEIFENKENTIDMANDLIEIKADENELMINIKNIFLNEFLKKKII